MSGKKQNTLKPHHLFKHHLAFVSVEMSSHGIGMFGLPVLRGFADLALHLVRAKVHDGRQADPHAWARISVERMAEAGASAPAAKPS